MKPVLSLTYNEQILDLINDFCEQEIICNLEIVPDSFVLESELDLLHNLVKKINATYTFHCVSGSIASDDFIEKDVYQSLYKVLNNFNNIYISDHLTCSRSDDRIIHANLSPTLNNSKIDTVLFNINSFIDKINPKSLFLLENIPRYFSALGSTYSSHDFYLEIVKNSKVKVLLDLHNLYCDELNYGMNPISFLKQLPVENVIEIHVAGGYFSDSGETYFDGHSSKVPSRVYELLEISCTLFKPKIINLEREHALNSPVLYDDIKSDVFKLKTIIDKYY